MNAGPVIAITTGDPCGIGPEVILKAVASSRIAHRARLVIIGDRRVFEQTARMLRRRLPTATFIDCGHRTTYHPGRSSSHAGQASLDYLNHAIALWKARQIQALVTGPVTKWAIQRSLPTFVGQTEHLARAMGVRDVAMMFVSDRLRVVLLTRHLALRDVPRSVDRRLIRTTARLTAEALRRHFHLRRPRLAFCGLNPHGGEAGAFGDEERRLLLPVMRELRRGGIRCEGPFAADGLFATDAQRYDAVMCWYHDQGLIPFKMAARDAGCQLSVGLPIVRTSPDHGSALDIAGRGIAEAGSMRYALELAARLARHVNRD